MPEFSPNPLVMASHISETCHACLLLLFLAPVPYSLNVWTQALLGTPSLISVCLIEARIPAGVSGLKGRMGSLTQNTPIINNVALKTSVCVLIPFYNIPSYRSIFMTQNIKVPLVVLFLINSHYLIFARSLMCNDRWHSDTVQTG